LNKHIYILSGLGADERAFQKLDFSGHTVTFINWITPLHKETIESYSSRLLSQIETTKPTLVGLSFGGIVAVEIAKQIETENIILIASAKTKNEIPFYFRLAGEINLQKLLPTKFLKRTNWLTNWFFGVSSNDAKELLSKILVDSDPAFMKWAIDTVVGWSNNTKLDNIKHIHGSADRIFPICFVDYNVKINGGGHFMTINKHQELTKLILQDV